MAAKFILPAIALAGTAFAQCSDDITIKSQSDATGIASCSQYEGSITIDSSVSGTLTLDGIETIGGDLICKNATQLSSIEADQLGTIAGTFNLNGLTILSTLSMGRLNRVNHIQWIALPAIQQLSFDQGVSEANTIYISNTGLTSLSGIELTQVGAMDVNNNQFLKTINVNSLTNVTDSLSFSANGMDLSIEFPNLEGAANLTFRNISSVSMPSLSNVAGAMGFYSNYFDTFVAPNLTATGGTIAFVDNPQLSNLTFPELTLIGGGLQLANNSKLDLVTGFNEVKTIDGDISFAGTFSKVSFNSLTDVKGAANVITSSSNTTVCKLFDAAAQQQVIKGHENCSSGVASPETNGSSSSGSSESHNFARPAAGWDPTAPLTGLTAFIAALLFL